MIVLTTSKNIQVEQWCSTECLMKRRISPNTLGIPLFTANILRTLHSKKALKILKSFPKVNNKHPIEESIGSKRFSEMKKKLKPYF